MTPCVWVNLSKMDQMISRRYFREHARQAEQAVGHLQQIATEKSFLWQAVIRCRTVDWPLWLNLR